MVEQKKKSGVYIQSILSEASMPRNQIATLSGLSNTYIRDLENGSFKNVDREKLIALAMAINLSLERIDEMLGVFDRTQLTRDDIPTFLNLVRKRTLSSAMIPLFDGFSLLHAILAIEAIPGEYIVAGRTLPVVLKSSEHRVKGIAFPKKKAHPLYNELTDAYRLEKKRNFIKLIKKYPLHHYICIDCLENYLKKSPDRNERDMRISHIKNTIQAIENYPNLIYHLIPPCLRTHFTLKLATGRKEKTDKLSLAFEHSHWLDRTRYYQSGRLVGFQTNNPSVIDSFKREVENMSAQELKKYNNRSRLIDFLNRLLQTT